MVTAVNIHPSLTAGLIFMLADRVCTNIAKEEYEYNVHSSITLARRGKRKKRNGKIRSPRSRYVEDKVSHLLSTSIVVIRQVSTKTHQRPPCDYYGYPYYCWHQ
jgi:hypothetical protein